MMHTSTPARAHHAQHDALEDTSLQKLSLRMESMLLSDKVHKNIRIHTYADMWESYYKQLLLFKARFGHVNVSKCHDPTFTALSRWSIMQKHKHSHKQLHHDKYKKLLAVGFTFEAARTSTVIVISSNSMFTSLTPIHNNNSPSPPVHTLEVLR